MNNWYDFNTATDQQLLDLIPHGTLAKVRMTIKPGGYNNDYQGLTGGYVTKSPLTGTLYLNTEYVILEGPYAKRRVWGQIGIHSEKSELYGNRGRSFIKAVLESAHNLHSNDTSEKAQTIRRLGDCGTLQGLAFYARIDVRTDQQNKSKNEISFVITPDHKDYTALAMSALTVPLPQTAPTTAVPIWSQSR